jgi:hypothetical protein
MSLIDNSGRVGTPKDFTVDLDRSAVGGSDAYIKLVGEDYPYNTTEHAAAISGETLTATIAPTTDNLGKVRVVGEVIFPGDTDPSQSDNGQIIHIGKQESTS